MTETEHECLDAWNDQDCWRRVAAEMPERELVGAYLLVVLMGALLGVWFTAYGLANELAWPVDLAVIFAMVSVAFVVFVIDYTVKMAKFLRRLRRAALPLSLSR